MQVNSDKPKAYLDTKNELNFEVDDGMMTKMFFIETLVNDTVKIIDVVKGNCLTRDVDYKLKMKTCGVNDLNQQFTFITESNLNNTLFIGTLCFNNKNCYFNKENSELKITQNHNDTSKFIIEPILSESDDENNVKHKVKIVEYGQTFYLNKDKNKLIFQIEYSTPWNVTDIKEKNEIRIIDVNEELCVTTPEIFSIDKTISLRKCQTKAIPTQYFKKHANIAVLQSELRELDYYNDYPLNILFNNKYYQNDNNLINNKTIKEYYDNDKAIELPELFYKFITKNIKEENDVVEKENNIKEESDKKDENDKKDDNLYKLDKMVHKNLNTSDHHHEFSNKNDRLENGKKRINDLIANGALTYKNSKSSSGSSSGYITVTKTTTTTSKSYLNEPQEKVKKLSLLDSIKSFGRSFLYTIDN
ncbi:hypothetical protein A0H76_1150 [Hepatospora eriocheir]|uniref:Uncharacterized protein n=1 Tax=Hepatospora eriocheir TaxID=1081669 RepID=A0A1X0QHK2_9MICR|nr:hypothetical protein A0H76_1150 [Hepatospora eriocheir]